MRNLLCLALLLGCGCAPSVEVSSGPLGGDASAPDGTVCDDAGTMTSAMFIDTTGSYFLGGCGLPEGYAASLGDEVIDLSDSPAEDWPI